VQIPGSTYYMLHRYLNTALHVRHTLRRQPISQERPLIPKNVVLRNFNILAMDTVAATVRD